MSVVLESIVEFFKKLAGQSDKEHAMFRYYYAEFGPVEGPRLFYNWKIENGIV